jgi:anti-sigma factor RsiW
VANRTIAEISLQAYLDDELEPESEAMVRQSLAASAEARQQLNRLKEVNAALESWPLAAEPAQLSRRIMAGIRSSPQLRPFRVRWADLAAGAAAALLYSAATLLWSRVASGGQAAHTTAALARLARLGVAAVRSAQNAASDPAVACGLLSTAAALVTAALTLPFWYPTLREEAVSLLGGQAE